MPHPCEIPRGRDAFLDADAGKRLPRKIVLKKSDFNKLDSKTQGIIRKYNNEVKIYSNYYRKIYKVDEPLFVILPLSSLDIDFIKALGKNIVLDDDLIDFNNEKNKDINSIKKKLINNVPKFNLYKTNDQPFVRDYFIEELKEYNTAVYNYYKKNQTEFKACLGLPKFPSNVKKIVKNYEEMINERRNKRDLKIVGTAQPYPAKQKAALSPSDIKLKPRRKPQ